MNFSLQDRDALIRILYDIESSLTVGRLPPIHRIKELVTLMRGDPFVIESIIRDGQPQNQVPSILLYLQVLTVRAFCHEAPNLKDLYTNF